MKIILSTYNFYPFHKGGTEVYTKALAAYLTSQHHQVLIIAALDEGIEKLETAVVRMNDQQMKAIQYRYDDFDVIGVQLKDQQTEDIYTNEKEVWTESFKQLLQHCGWQQVQHVILNGISTVSGPSLFNAAYELNSSVKIDVIVHTPFICPKADMIYEKTGTRCDVEITPAICTACLISANTNLPYQLSRLLDFIVNSTFLPKLTKATGIRLQSLLKEKIKSFDRIDNKINKWVVFSEDMRQFMSQQRFISPEKIMVLRHGIDKTVFNGPPARPTAPATFLYAGRFEDIKGVNILCDAWQLLPDEPGFRMLYLAGNWNESKTGKNIKASLENRKDVLFISTLSQQQLADQYRKTHCVIIPSKWVETGPMVFHEAVACGCDIISSDIGGQGELAQEYKKKSLTFQSGSSRKLYEAIIKYKPTGTANTAEAMSSEEHFEKLTSSLMIA